MTRPHDPDRIGSRLLSLDEPPNDPSYPEYRMNLENALATAERRERIAGNVAAASFAIGLLLMFVGGTRLIGDFDPWSKEATPFSIAAGLIYVVACVTFPLALAVGLSRFRPGVQALKEQIRDTLLLDLRREVRELREQVAALARRNGTNPQDPHAG